jgi:hypothetical protein
MAPLPEALFHCAVYVLGSSIVVLGGCRSSHVESAENTTYCYNTATNVWSTLAPMPKAKMNHSVCEVSGLIYVIGGEADSAIPVDSVHCLDPAMNEWSTVAPMLNPRAGFVSYVLGGTIYAAGGVDGVDTLSSVEHYDVTSDSWEVVSDMALSDARADLRAQVIRLEVGLFDSLEAKARCARS